MLAPQRAASALIGTIPFILRRACMNAYCIQSANGVKLSPEHHRRQVGVGAGDLGFSSARLGGPRRRLAPAARATTASAVRKTSRAVAGAPSSATGPLGKR